MKLTKTKVILSEEIMVLSDTFSIPRFDFRFLCYTRVSGGSISENRIIFLRKGS
jgi:hypothetical protein